MGNASTALILRRQKLGFPLKRFSATFSPTCTALLRPTVRRCLKPTQSYLCPLTGVKTIDLWLGMLLQKLGSGWFSLYRHLPQPAWPMDWDSSNLMSGRLLLCTGWVESPLTLPLFWWLVVATPYWRVLPWMVLGGTSSLRC